MVFSFANWDFVYGHFPFRQKERSLLKEYDGKRVEQIGESWCYIEDLGPGFSPMFSDLALAESGQTALSGDRLKANRQLLMRYKAVQRKEILSIPYSFTTPIIILDRATMLLYLAMGNISGQDKDGYIEFELQTAPFETNVIVNIAKARPLCDGFLKNNDRYMIYLVRIDQLMEELQYFEQRGYRYSLGKYPKFNYSLAYEYYESLLGFEDEDRCNLLAATYENKCMEILRCLKELSGE